MPNDPGFAIACLLGSSDGAGNGFLDGVELVVARDDFTQAGTGVAKDDEILD
jgi:hypothetical protein